MLDQEHTKALAYELSHRSLAQVMVETGLLVLIALTALVGNSCVLYVFYKTPRLCRVTSYYIITLAIADIGQALIVMPMATAVSASGRDVVGHRLGQAKGFMCTSLVSGSLLTTALIGINRYFCVVKPKIYKKIFSPKHSMLMIIGIWIFATCLFAFFFSVGWIEFEFYPGMHLYFIDFSQKSVIPLLTLCVGLFIVFPLLVIVVCYRKIYQVVKQHNISTNLNTESSLTKEEIHISISLLALICGFVICWIPAITVYSLIIFMDLPRSVELIPTYTVYCSSAVNPIIYNIFNKPFRKVFLAIFKARVTRITPVNSQSRVE